MELRDVESRLPPGFRFFPSDEELVCYYLYMKVASSERDHSHSEGATLVEVDLHTREPWELPEVARLSPNEWYFFSFRDRKYATGPRTNRATKTGYWKATGKDRTVHEPATRAAVGMRKTLVFYLGRAPNGVKTGWVMHEFRLETPHMPPKEDWVLCRVFDKRKAGGTAERADDQQDGVYYADLDRPSSKLEEDSSTLPNHHRHRFDLRRLYHEHLGTSTGMETLLQHNDDDFLVDLPASEVLTTASSRAGGGDRGGCSYEFSLCDVGLESISSSSQQQCHGRPGWYEDAPQWPGDLL